MWVFLHRAGEEERAVRRRSRRMEMSSESTKKAVLKNLVFCSRHLKAANRHLHRQLWGGTTIRVRFGFPSVMRGNVASGILDHGKPSVNGEKTEATVETKFRTFRRQV